MFRNLIILRNLYLDFVTDGKVSIVLYLLELKLLRNKKLVKLQSLHHCYLRVKDTKRLTCFSRMKNLLIIIRLIELVRVWDLVMKTICLKYNNYLVRLDYLISIYEYICHGIHNEVCMEMRAMPLT